MARVARAYDRGWRHGSAWSALAPAGEIGDTHVALMDKITRDEFDAAKSRGWQPE
jgi:hypothetical protein